MDCKTCGHAKFRIATDKWECQLPTKIQSKCFKENGSLWVGKENVCDVITAEILAKEVAEMIYNQGKAKIFNILESQIEDGSRLRACKRITQDVIGQIAQNAIELTGSILGGWQAKNTDPQKAEPEYEKMKEEIKEILK